MNLIEVEEVEDDHLVLQDQIQVIVPYTP